ncbi:hypothetical protein GC170_02175 [bacterium]|nr:hypothetical protein [bacterium]
MRANSAKTRNSAIGLIALVAIGCVQNRQARVEKTPLASEQGGWIKKFPYLTSNTGRQSVFENPSQWPAKPAEEVVQTRFAQLFPNLSRRSSGRVNPSTASLAETPVESDVSLDALAASETPAEQRTESATVAPEPPPADAAVATTEPTTSSVTDAAPESARSSAKVDWATLSANSAGVASVVAALAAVADAEVISTAEVRAEAEGPESVSQEEAVAAKPALDPQSASPTAESATQVADQTEVATPPAAAEPVAQAASADAVESDQPVGESSAGSTAVAASSPEPEKASQPAASEVVANAETARSPLTAVHADDLPATLPPAVDAVSDTNADSVATPLANSAPVAEPVAQSEAPAAKELEIPGITTSVDQPENATEQAKAERSPSTDPVPQVAIRERDPATPVPALPATSQVLTEQPVAAMPAASAETPKPMPEIPAIPAEEVKSAVAVTSPKEAGQAEISVASPATVTSSAVPAPAVLTAPEVPPIPAAPAPEPVVPGLPANEPVAQPVQPAPAAPVLEAPAPQELPARTEANAGTLEIPGVPAAVSSTVTEPSNPAARNVPEPPAAANTQRQEPANVTPMPAPAELPGSLAEPPPPAPAPELQVPGISERPLTNEPQAKSPNVDSPSDAGVERSSGATFKGVTPDASESAVVPASDAPDAVKPVETGPDSGAASGADSGEEIPVLQPLPDDDTAQVSEGAGSAIERKPGELVIHLRLSNPFRLSRFRSTPDDQPSQVSTTRGLKSAARNLFAWQRGTKTVTVEAPVDSDFPSEEPAPVAQPEPATDVAEKPEEMGNTEAVAVSGTEPAVVEQVADDVEPAVAARSQTGTTISDAVANADSRAEAKDHPEIESTRRSSRIAAFFVPGRTQAMANPAPARTSNGLPAVEFPASYHAARPRSANPWYAHAKPAVNPLADPRRDMAPVTAIPATPAPVMPVTKTASKPALRPDLEIVRTSLNVPAASTPVPAVIKAETPKDQPVAKVSSSWWSNSGKGLRRMILGEEEVVPPKRPNWAKRQSSDR